MHDMHNVRSGENKTNYISNNLSMTSRVNKRYTIL